MGNNKSILKIVFFFLILSVAFVTFACNNESNINNNNLPDNADTIDNETDEKNAAEEVIPFPHEVRDFGGETFKILIDRQWEQNHLDITDFDIEEITGEVLNDAYYTRNLLMEEIYNIKLEGIRVDDITNRVPRIIKAGLDEYDALTPRLMNAGNFASKGFGVNVLETILTLDAPWWDQNIIRDLSIGNTAYIIAGDLFIKHYDGIAMLMFNKRLLGDLALESPYAFVQNNQWTMDKFNEMVKTATRDLSGDGTMGRYDQYGFVTQGDYVTSFINASGEKIISKDQNDMPYFTGFSDKMVNVFDKMLDVYIYHTYCMHRNAFGKDGGGGQIVQFWIFPEGRGLFYWAFPRYIDWGLRNMEDDFGILPIPKWDSEQDRYYATLNNWHSYTYMMPITVSDIERNAYILDAMSYHGRQIIKPAYYDVCLQRKYTRDDESSAMLDIVFSSTVYDLGTVFNIGGYIGALESDIQNERNNMASLYERSLNRIEKDITNLIMQCEENRQ